MPISWAYRPENIAARAGTQNGLTQYAESNRVPRRTSESMFGVCARGWP